MLEPVDVLQKKKGRHWSMMRVLETSFKVHLYPSRISKNEMPAMNEKK